MSTLDLESRRRLRLRQRRPIIQDRRAQRERPMRRAHGEHHHGRSVCTSKQQQQASSKQQHSLPEAAPIGLARALSAASLAPRWSFCSQYLPYLAHRQPHFLSRKATHGSGVLSSASPSRPLLCNAALCAADPLAPLPIPSSSPSLSLSLSHLHPPSCPSDVSIGTHRQDAFPSLATALCRKVGLQAVFSARRYRSLPTVAMESHIRVRF